MSFAVRNSFRTVARAARSRNNSSIATAAENGAALEKFLEADKALAHHAAEASDLWRKISYYVALPAIAVCTAWVYNTEVEHAAHVEHIKQENGGVLPESPAYDYQNRRGKPFPWGPNSLFFNPHANKDMSGV
ncbi:cytochrome c oxidase, subunit VIa [Flammula alnicola]|nr:cytochrome c oxidase, subunit VIa [Flammula alnicola]